MQWYFILLAQFVLIYLLSQHVMRSIFYFLKKATRSTSVSFYLLSLIYVPGTIVHEVSHLLTSILLFVMPHSINLIPQLEENDNAYHMKFGSVHHRKTDPLRGFLIGSSPLFAGLLYFYCIDYFNLLHISAPITLLVVYLSFSISSTMFSSKEDMKEAIFIVPLGLLAISALIAFDVDVVGYLLSPKAISTIRYINISLLPATLLNMALGASMSILGRSK